MEATLSPNAAQIDYWNTTAGTAWAKYHDQLDRQISSLGHEAMRSLAIKAGERVLDLGCGCGHTTIEIAARVGPTGSATGVDISVPMLAIAMARVPRPNAGPIEFRQQDLQTDDLGSACFDAAFSRFGVMFFSEPALAFRNVHRALRPGGRLGFVCWRPLLSNAWMLEPLEAARSILPPSAPQDPLAPGPFAFEDAARVRGILTEAGFTNIDLTRFDTLIGGGSVDEALEVALRVGPLGRALGEHPELLPELIGSVRKALERHLTSKGVLMPASVWIVRAEARS
jgi:SAM-dependent methyltransferase